MSGLWPGAGPISGSSRGCSRRCGRVLGTSPKSARIYPPPSHRTDVSQDWPLLLCASRRHEGPLNPAHHHLGQPHPLSAFCLVHSQCCGIRVQPSLSAIIQGSHALSPMVHASSRSMLLFPFLSHSVDISVLSYLLPLPEFHSIFLPSSLKLPFQTCQVRALPAAGPPLRS